MNKLQFEEFMVNYGEKVIHPTTKLESWDLSIKPVIITYKNGIYHGTSEKRKYTPRVQSRKVITPVGTFENLNKARQHYDVCYDKMRKMVELGTEGFKYDE